MTINEVAGLLGYSRERAAKLIAEGIALPKSGAVVMLATTGQGDAADVSEQQFDEFVAKIEAEEPGRWPPAAVRRNLLVEAKHRCAICADSAPLQFHHMLDWAKIKHHDARHMLALCGTCHTRCTNGLIDYQAQLAYKRKLGGAGATPAEKMEELPILQNAHPECNPVHRIIDLLVRYHGVLNRVHHADTREARLAALAEWSPCHAAVWANSPGSRNNTIRNLADPAKAWLTRTNSRFVQPEDVNLVEEGADTLSVFAVSSSPTSMPDLYSNADGDEDERWRRWGAQGERYLALGDLIARLRDLAARAGQMWDPPQAK